MWDLSPSQPGPAALPQGTPQHPNPFLAAGGKQGGCSIFLRNTEVQGWWGHSAAPIKMLSCSSVHHRDRQQSPEDTQGHSRPFLLSGPIFPITVTVWERNFSKGFGKSQVAAHMVLAPS